MTARSRPIHCGFETLRHANEVARRARGGYSRLGGTNEQMIARGTEHTSRHFRPTALFSDFRSY
jgi:hypothetical protein